MNENLNLVEILKDCPEGTKLYSPIYGDVEFLQVLEDSKEDYQIDVKLSDNTIDNFTKDGRINAEYNGECVLFPSREQRDWSQFKIKKAKFDPTTLNTFDKVLVKTGTKSYHVWLPDFISLPPNDVDEAVICIFNRDDVVMAIPYNEETKHLVETNEEAHEFYRYWED